MDERNSGRMKTSSVLFAKGWIAPKFLIPKEQFVEFVVGLDDDNNEISKSCDQRTFKNENDFLVPIFFKRDVLNHYFAKTSKYSVEDGLLRCANLWILPIDNNHPNCIVAYLGDLGVNLPYSDQCHWRAFNLTGGTISDTAINRDFNARFIDPVQNDLIFKNKFLSLQKAWTNKFGWPLHIKFHADDQYILKSLRVPLTDEQQEFDAQILFLTRILIDSLNEKELEKGITHEKGAKGLTKLQVFLKLYNIPNEILHGVMKPLRDLQELRSSSIAHRKGSGYSKNKIFEASDDTDLSKTFDVFLALVVEVVAALEKFAKNLEVNNSE
jgi:hypothetical protein